MVKTIDRRSKFSYNVFWIGIGIFALSGILPWFMVQFPVGHLNISVLDIGLYFSSQQQVELDFYSSSIYALLLTGWIFTIIFLIVAVISKKGKLLAAGICFSTIPPVIWAIIVPYLKIQMIFLSLSNQPIDIQQSLGPGTLTAIAGGIIVFVSYLKSRSSLQ